MRWIPDSPAAEPGGWHSVDDVVAAFRELASAPLPAIDPPRADADLYGIKLFRAFDAAYRRDHPELYLAARRWERADVLAAREAGRAPSYRIMHERAHLPVCAARRYSAKSAPPPPF